MGLRISSGAELKAWIKILQLKELKAFNSLRLSMVVTEILIVVFAVVLIEIAAIDTDRKNSYVISA
jgi:hypothetical protein